MIGVAKKEIDNLKYRRMEYKKRSAHYNKLLCVIVRPGWVIKGKGHLTVSFWALKIVTGEA